MRFHLKVLFKSNIAIYFIFLSLTLLCYVNIFPNQLFYDDEELIYKNTYVADLHYLPKYFTQNMVAGAGKVSNMYRPILLTSFAIDYFFWGTNPSGYHLTSIFLHFANSVLIFFLLFKLFGSKILAVLSAVFFIIHPVQTEAVTYASGRTDLLYSLFGLICLSSFLFFCTSKKSGLIYYLFSILFFVLSLLSKETAIVLPAVIIFCYYIISRKNENNISPNYLILAESGYFFIASIYIFLRLTIFNFANTLNFYQNTNLYSQNIAVRVFTFTGVFFEYLKILFFPRDLIFSRNADVITSPFHLPVIAFIILLVSISVFFLKTGSKNRLSFFSFSWFLIFLLPSSGIIPINSIIAEHYLYLPSVGLFLFISSVSVMLWTKYADNYLKYLLIIILVIIISGLSFRTVKRNRNWKDAITFYRISLNQSPGNIPMRHNLAMAYSEKGDLETAIKEYQYIIANSDVYPNTHHNLGNIYKEQKKYQEAEEEYLNALELDHNFNFSYYALVDLYKLTGDTEKQNNIIELLKNKGLVN